MQGEHNRTCLPKPSDSELNHSLTCRVTLLCLSKLGISACHVIPSYARNQARARASSLFPPQKRSLVTGTLGTLGTAFVQRHPPSGHPGDARPLTKATSKPNGVGIRLHLPQAEERVSSSEAHTRVSSAPIRVTSRKTWADTE